ncbi:auxilin-related protein 1-like isoform X2 [Phragmites australis]|uniref:auxilin-related protein 1-like isoform X2 n=1 Tax=Phragmites australis TaxID=29695 RepID=UPI002D77C4DE|nr:auxilin-related protein 1-like isoform X2 [Phragmites australis]
MDDFQGLLARDFGLRPQGKAAPMSAARTSATSGSAWTNPRSTSASTNAPSAPSYDDLFGTAASAPPPKATPSPSVDSIFESFKEPSAAAPPPKPKPKHSSMPVFDKPVYDDDIFDGVPGVKSSSARHDDVFGGSHAPPPAYDDLLGGFGKKSEAREEVEKRKPEPAAAAASSTGFDDLIPGFGGSSLPRRRETVGAKEKKVSMSTSKPTADMASDPFVVLETTLSSAHPSSGIFADPLDELGKPAKYQGKNRGSSAIDSGLFEGSRTFNQAPKSEPLFTSEMGSGSKDRNDSSRARASSPVQSYPGRNSAQQPSVEDFENIFPKSQSARHSDVHVDIGGNVNDQSPRSDESEDEIWLTVSEIPLFTQPTSSPPPSRPPPPLAIKQKQHGSKAKRKDDEYLRRSNQNYNHQRSSSNQAGVSSIDELEDFAMGKSQNAGAFNEEEFERSTAAAASAAAMKEAMDKAEAKFKHAKEFRERERDAKLRNREQQEQDNEARSYTQDHKEKERKERLERERQREEKEREQRKLEEERELERQRGRERDRQAVERATKEARERAASEARAKAEREARQCAERAAVQRAQQEARERAAVEAKEQAERAAAEAKEKAASQARDRAAAERAAVERAQQEARRRAERAAVERAAAEARERQAAATAAAAREKQSKPDDLESFFGMGARANSAPKQRAPTGDSMFDSQTQNRGTSTSASMKKASSTTNITDDLSAIFGGAPTSSEEFQEIDGESEERRRARFERHQRTRERAAKALAEKNERDMQNQREQAERHRIAETLDFEIKRWAAGKEGNLRALLSTLQYVLWPECGWQPVSLTDLITAAAVKKVYRKATLCIHPDKVQQKGANLQQKYIAEKVFDLLKEAWNKFNSEELF